MPIGSILLSSIAFVVGFLPVELVTLRWAYLSLHVRGVPSTPSEESTQAWEFVLDLYIECRYAVCALLVIFCVQLALEVTCRHDAGARRRHFTWFIALLCGWAFSWIRWGVWFAWHPIPEKIDWTFAMLLAAVLSRIVYGFRWPAAA